MRRDELKSILRQEFTVGAKCGVARVSRSGYENIWFVVPPAPPRSIPANMPATNIAEAMKVMQSRPPASEASDLHRLAAYLFSRREAVSSSRMEGTWSTVDEALTPGEEEDPGYSGDDPSAGSERSHHAAVRGYAVALEAAAVKVQDEGLNAFTIGLIEDLHRGFMTRAPDFTGIAGRIRQPGLPGDVVQIGGLGRKEQSIYNPAPPEHVQRCLAEVMCWIGDQELIEMGDAGMGMPLPVRIAIAHSHFEAVHPFPDGNGRVGRMLWPLQMLASDHLPLYLSGYVEAHKDEYGNALQEAQKQLSYSHLVRFICDAIVASDFEERESIKAIGTLSEVWMVRGNFRRRSTARRALELLAKRPIVTVKTLARELDVSGQSANEALKALFKKGIVSERTGKRRDRIFAAEEVIALLARPFAQDPEIALEGARRKLGV